MNKFSRNLLPACVAGFMFFVNSLFLTAEESSPAPIALGETRELFLDDYLIAQLEDVSLLVHEPERKEISLVLDKPWEGASCNYMTVLYDPELKRYRIYYKCWHLAELNDLGTHKDSVSRIAMLESGDGIVWTRPNLGLVDYDGSKENNLLLDSGHDFSPFIDKNPKARPEERYKAMGSYGGGGLHIYVSPDGVHWKRVQNDYVYTQGAFDSQNVAFWSPNEQKYVAYFRVFIDDVRHIERIVSDDFIHWTSEGLIQFPQGEGPVARAQFYVNQIFPYPRAPQLYLGFPVRYIDNGETESMKYLPEYDLRQARMKAGKRLGTAVTDSVYISSRDGRHFRQSNDVFLRPGLREKNNWTYGDNYLAWNVVQTKSPEDDSPEELSLYATESYMTGNDSIFRRYAMRIDGFGSLHAKTKLGTAVTKPITFSGKELTLNYRTSGAGLLRVELCDMNGKPLKGYSREDCDVLYGDSIDRTVSWGKNTDLSSLAGQTVVLKFYMQEADLYSLQFK